MLSPALTESIVGADCAEAASLPPTPTRRLLSTAACAMGCAHSLSKRLFSSRGIGMFDVEVFDPATNKDVSFSNIMSDADARQTPHQRLHDQPSDEQSDLHAIEERPPPATRTGSNAASSSSTRDTASLPTTGGDLAAQWQSAHGQV